MRQRLSANGVETKEKNRWNSLLFQTCAVSHFTKLCPATSLQLHSLKIHACVNGIIRCSVHRSTSSNGIDSSCFLALGPCSLGLCSCLFFFWWLLAWGSAVDGVKTMCMHAPVCISKRAYNRRLLVLFSQRSWVQCLLCLYKRSPNSVCLCWEVCWPWSGESGALIVVHCWDEAQHCPVAKEGSLIFDAD